MRTTFHQQPDTVTTAIAEMCALASRYYERYAGHAVEVGRRVIFQTTGITKTSTRPRT
jgi:phosphate uptake regulator